MRRLLKRSRHFGIPVENEAERVSAVTPAAAEWRPVVAVRRISPGDLAMVAEAKFHLSTNMLLSDLRHRMKNTDLKVLDVLEMATLTQRTEIIGEYPAPVFMLTRPLKGLCFKCRASESRTNHTTWPLLNRLILRFWPLGLRHGSDWLVSLLWHQYILITFVDTLTNSLHGTRPTELAV